MNKEKLTVRAFAKLCEITPVTVYDYMKRGLITPRETPIGKHYFLKEDVETLRENLKNYQINKNRS